MWRQEVTLERSIVEGDFSIANVSVRRQEKKGPPLRLGRSPDYEWRKSEAKNRDGEMHSPKYFTLRVEERLDQKQRVGGRELA